MAKRNQLNRPDLSTITELTLNKLRVQGNTQISGNLLVQSATNPEIRLKKSNPGAMTRLRILEETIDFSAVPDGTVFTSSLTLPQYSRVDAVGVYVGTSLSGAAYLHAIGLSGSGTGYNYDDTDYFFYSSPVTMRLSASGDSAVYFPFRGSTRYPAASSYLITGVTGSNVNIRFQTSATTNQTGSITFALYAFQYVAPTSA